MKSTVRTPQGTLSFIQDGETVYSDLPEPDPAWRHTDQQGHQHSYHRNGDHYPTLRWVIDSSYWCEDCNDEIHEGHWQCRTCGEHIQPGTRGPDPFGTWIPTTRRYELDGEPISGEQANQILAALKR